MPIPTTGELGNQWGRSSGKDQVFQKQQGGEWSNVTGHGLEPGTAGKHLLEKACLGEGQSLYF